MQKQPFADMFLKIAVPKEQVKSLKNTGEGIVIFVKLQATFYKD